MTRIASMLFVAIVAGLSGQVKADLVLYYDFENDSGTTINNVGSLGTAGTLSGNDVTTVGPVGGFTPTTARTFVGGSDVIDTNIGAALLGLQSSSYTATAWFRPTSNSGDNMFFSQSGGSNVLHLGTRGNNYHQGHWGNDTGAGGVDAIPLGDWRHVAYRYDNGTQEIFVNGVLLAIGTNKGPLNNAGNLWIGNSGRTNWGFPGDLDDVMVFDEALAANQIGYLANGFDPMSLPAASLNWDFGADPTLQGWTVLNGEAHFRPGDGGGMSAFALPGRSGEPPGFAHDGAHETFLVASPGIGFTGESFDGVNALLVEFAGGAGDQNNRGMIYDTPSDVIADNGGQSYDTGQKGLAFYNLYTGQYDATIFEENNGGVDVRTFTFDDLLALGIDPHAEYSLHYFETDQGGWGWGQLNRLQVAANLPEPGTWVLAVLGMLGFFGVARKR